MTTIDRRRKPHHRPGGFQNNYVEFASKTIAEVLRRAFTAADRGYRDAALGIDSRIQ